VIIVAGEALVDVIRRPGGAVVAVPGGGPFNTARTIGRLGLPVAWAGVLSTDEHGRTMGDALAADGVSLALVQRSALPTTQALAELDERGEARYRFLVEGSSAPSLERGELLAAAGRLSAAGGLRAAHVGTLGLVWEPMAGAIEALVDVLPDDVLLVVDPNCRPSAIEEPDAYRVRLGRVLARADVVKLSAADLAYLGPIAGGSIRVVTDAADPVRIEAGGRTLVVEVPPVKVVDTVGAGDTFGGAMLGWLVHAGVTRAAVDEAAILAAVRFAVRASSLACTRAGADPPTIAELGGWVP
jgi:fructokinase